MKQALSAIVLCLALTQLAYGQVVLQHSGSNNPLNEGFTVFTNSTDGTVKSFPTNALGTNAWAISDNSDNYRMRYQYTMTPAQTNLLNTNGWQLQWSLNIVSGDDTVKFANKRAIDISYVLGTTRYEFQFGKSNVGNNATVRIIGPVTDTLLSVPGGASGFHTWELNAAPFSTNASFLMDGVFLANYGGFANVTQVTNLFWGSLGDIGLGHADWGLVILQVPEPSALGLLSVAALMVAAFRRR